MTSNFVGLTPVCAAIRPDGHGVIVCADPATGEYRTFYEDTLITPVNLVVPEGLLNDPDRMSGNQPDGYEVTMEIDGQPVVIRSNGPCLFGTDEEPMTLFEFNSFTYDADTGRVVHIEAD